MKSTKRTLLICFLVGFSLVFLTSAPVKAYACGGSCYASTCILEGDVECDNGQYNYAAPCPGSLPDTCVGGGGAGSGMRWMPRRTARSETGIASVRFRLTQPNGR